MKSLILFDADTQHYRQSIYKFFHKELKKQGYLLKIYYDKNLNQINDEIFVGINYTLNNFNRVIKKNNCSLIILFVWLKYKFLLPLMVLNRIRGVKMITWSHGINLQKKNNTIMNQFYYLRQRLANALIIFSKNEKHLIKASHKKLFVANNTLNFYDFPKITASKKDLKRQYGLADKKVVLCVGRMNTNNRKLDFLLDSISENSLKSVELIIVGPGVTKLQEQKLNSLSNARYLGEIYDNRKINEIYKLSDIFCMPGAIGLAINQAFYYGMPVVVEDVPHGPEAVYLKDGENGFYFKSGDLQDMIQKIKILTSDDKIYQKFSMNAYRWIREEASIEKMLKGFEGAIDYVKKKSNSKY